MKEANNQSNEKVIERNTLAIIGFVLSFFLAIAGLVLSFMGYLKSRKTHSGRGLSIAGIMLSLVGILIKVLLIISVIDFANKSINIFDSTIGCIEAKECERNEDGTYICVYKNRKVTCEKEKIEAREDFNEIYEDASNTINDVKEKIDDAKDEIIGDRGNIYNELIEALKSGYSNINFTYTYGYDENNKPLIKTLNNFEKIPIVSELTLDTSIKAINNPTEEENPIFISIDFIDSKNVPVTLKIVKSDAYFPYYIVITKDNLVESYSTDSGINLFDNIKLEI